MLTHLLDIVEALFYITLDIGLIVAVKFVRHFGVWLVDTYAATEAKSAALEAGAWLLETGALLLAVSIAGFDFAKRIRAAWRDFKNG